MKTLEQWQKELPDYELVQGWGAVNLDWAKTEVVLNHEWVPMHREGGLWGAHTSQADQHIRASSLMDCGAIFRRKKERQREFKIERNPDKYDWKFLIDGKSKSLIDFLDSQNIKSATLTVNEWGGE